MGEFRQTEYFGGIFKAERKGKGEKGRREKRLERKRVQKGRHDVEAHGRSVFRDGVNTFRFTQTRFYSVIEVDSSPACIPMEILEEEQFRCTRAAFLFNGNCSHKSCTIPMQIAESVHSSLTPLPPRSSIRPLLHFLTGFSSFSANLFRLFADYQRAESDRNRWKRAR